MVKVRVIVLLISNFMTDSQDLKLDRTIDISAQEACGKDECGFGSYSSDGSTTSSSMVGCEACGVLGVSLGYIYVSGITEPDCFLNASSVSLVSEHNNYLLRNGAWVCKIISPLSYLEPEVLQGIIERASALGVDYIDPASVHD